MHFGPKNIPSNAGISNNHILDGEPNEACCFLILWGRKPSSLVDFFKVGFDLELVNDRRQRTGDSPLGSSTDVLHGPCHGLVTNFKASWKQQQPLIWGSSFTYNQIEMPKNFRAEQLQKWDVCCGRDGTNSDKHVCLWGSSIVKDISLKMRIITKSRFLGFIWMNPSVRRLRNPASSRLFCPSMLLSCHISPGHRTSKTTLQNGPK